MTAAFLPVHRRVEHLDTDASGVVHFARYASLLETALFENLDRAGAGDLDGNGCALVVTQLRMRYEASARFLDELRLSVTVEHVGAVQFRVAGAVARPGGEQLATGAFVFGAVDPATGQAIALPGQLATVLKEAGRAV